jgi:hypothetical protein
MFKLGGSFVVVLVGLVACTPSTSTKGQLITCETDPDSGVILSCQPGDDDDDDNDENECQDIDEDGDGTPDDDDDDDGDDDTSEPTDGGGGGVGVLRSPTEDDDHDEDGDGVCDGDDDDDDDDGIDDDDDCDEGEGGDSDESELPYDVKMDEGKTYTPIADAFAEKGGQPAAIVSVTFDGGGSWRATELTAGTSFTITPQDCAHVGNRDVGRDRVIVTWENSDGTTESDHLDLRYCE